MLAVYGFSVLLFVPTELSISSTLYPSISSGLFGAYPEKFTKLPEKFTSPPEILLVLLRNSLDFHRTFLISHGVLSWVNLVEPI